MKTESAHNKILQSVIEMLPYMIVATALVIAIVVSGIKISPQKAKMSLVDNSLADLDADESSL
ncbi:hypothetical protein SAMN02910292_00046 [Lachnospiraceae bacterium XBB2008]|nr:hypothetical protein SAMN02910292_00046 [Lachnospiraceae bacterium XBB2008]